jgi:VanZ family protein
VLRKTEREDAAVVRWLIWTFVIIAWTVALEAPVPIPESPGSGSSVLTARMLFSKSLHVAAYAFLTVLSAWPRLPTRYRWLMMFFLMAHATATEVLQVALHEWCGRGGSLWDVALDQIGILIGFVIGWKWWMRPDA